MGCRSASASGTLPLVTAPTTRVVEVQSLRAIAILLVAGYHYFASWTMPIDGNNLYPGTFAAIFKYTYLGVELFFMVSGFVISMTLLRSSSALHFMAKRFIRLWPALFFALPLVWLVGNRFGPDLYLHPWTDLVTSLTLIDPAVFNARLPITVDWTTAVLWTMWIEVQFYLIAALLFFLLRRHFVTALGATTFVVTLWIIAAQVGWVSADVTDAVLPSVSVYLPWFLAGALFHRMWHEQVVRLPDALALIAILTYEAWRLWYLASAGAIWLPTFFFLAFTAIVRQWQMATLLRASALVFLGEISYEFYLVHDTLGVTVITVFLERFGFTSGAHLFAAIIGLMVSLVTAFVIYWLSTPIRHALTSGLNRRRGDQSEKTAVS